MSENNSIVNVCIQEDHELVRIWEDLELVLL